MKKKFAVQAAAFQPAIHVGRINKAATAFLDGKEDATDMVIRAVADYATRNFGGALKAEYSDYDVDIRITPKDLGENT
jgi:hypothetical protein